MYVTCAGKRKKNCAIGGSHILLDYVLTYLLLVVVVVVVMMMMMMVLDPVGISCSGGIVGIHGTCLSTW
jgi:hypothetical protein